MKPTKLNENEWINKGGFIFRDKNDFNYFIFMIIFTNKSTIFFLFSIIFSKYNNNN